MGSHLKDLPPRCQIPILPSQSHSQCSKPTRILLELLLNSTEQLLDITRGPSNAFVISRTKGWFLLSSMGLAKTLLLQKKQRTGHTSSSNPYKYLFANQHFKNWETISVRCSTGTAGNTELGSSNTVWNWDQMFFFSKPLPYKFALVSSTPRLAKDMTPKITEMHSLYNNLLDTQQKNCIPGETRPG